MAANLLPNLAKPDYVSHCHRDGEKKEKEEEGGGGEAEEQKPIIEQ